jgi:DNA repair protein RadA/Sms
VDLNGQIRPVSSHSIRLNQATKLGYAPLFCPLEENSPFYVKTVAELQQKLFRK